MLNIILVGLSFLKKIYLILHVWMFCMHTCMYVHHRHTWFLWIPRTRVKDGCEPPCGCWKLTCILCRNSNCFYLLSHYPSPLVDFLLLVCMCVLVEVRVQPSGVSSLLPAWDLRVGHRWSGLLSKHLPTDPYCLPLEDFLTSFFWWVFTLLFVPSPG